MTPHSSAPARQIVDRYPQLGDGDADGAIAQEIESHGCFLKDIDHGLIDFPVGDRGRPRGLPLLAVRRASVTSWHPVDGGFGQRQPLPGVAKPYLN